MQSIYDDNDIDYICTWRDTAIQVLSVEIAKLNNIKVRIATRMRLPKERIFFCSDINTSSVVKLQLNTNESNEIEESWEDLINIKPEWKVSARSLTDVLRLMPLHFGVFKSYLLKSIHDKGNHYNRYSILEILFKYIQRRYRLVVFKFKQNNFNQTIPDKFIYFGLHTQPESSIDYQGGNFTNQLNFVQNLRKNTPSNINIVIKVHPTDVDGKPFSYFKNFINIPGVTVLSYTYNSSELIRKSLYVVTLTGTAGIEAICASKPVVTFAKNYYNMYDGVTYCNSWDSYSKYASKVPPKVNNIRNKEIFNDFLKFTFKGEVSRAYGSNPKGLTELDELLLMKTYNEVFI